MKTLLRTAIVLAVAVLVAAGFYMLGQRNALGFLSPGGAFERGFAEERFRVEGRGRGEFGEDFGFVGSRWLFVLLSFVPILTPILVVILAVLLIRTLWRRLRPRASSGSA